MLTTQFNERKRRLIKNVGSKVLWSFENMMERHSLVGNSAVLDAREDDAGRRLLAALEDVLRND